MRDFYECRQIIEEFLHQWDTTDIGWRIKNRVDNTQETDLDELNAICDEIEDIVY
jgi:hypothetical protein